MDISMADMPQAYKELLRTLHRKAENFEQRFWLVRYVINFN